MQGNFRGGIERIRVVGREELTLAERAREEFLLLLLRQERSLARSQFIKLLWFAPLPSASATLRVKRTTPSADFPSLNPSQGEVADAIVADTEPLVIAHGGVYTRVLEIPG